MLGEEPLLLHLEAFWVCPWACSCYVALREKRLPFGTSLALLSDDQDLLPTYQDLTVTARVPALQHGSFWIAESSAIVEYLEDRFPPPQYPRLFPESAPERARARQVMAWMRSGLTALREEWDAALIFYPPSEPPALSRAGERDVAKLVRAAERLVPAAGRSMFAEWCIADVDLAFALKRLVANRYPLAPRLRDYAEAVWQRPSVREFVTHPRPPHSVWCPGNLPPRA